MKSKKTEVPCTVCNPAEAKPGQYCDLHREKLHRLDHQYETLFRIQRISRGKDHEAYNLFLQGDCDPCGRVLVTETDPENLCITILISSDLDLDANIDEYSSLKLERNFGDQLRDRIRQEIIHSWYGNARACVDIFRTSLDQLRHWDVEPRVDQCEEGEEPPPTDEVKHSIH